MTQPDFTPTTVELTLTLDTRVIADMERWLLRQKLCGQYCTHAPAFLAHKICQSVKNKETSLSLVYKSKDPNFCGDE
jgi:hypothetical protein